MKKVEEMTWYDHQDWEKEWHSTCHNSLNEELKQLVYAKKMGLKFTHDGKTPYNIDLQKKNILDIGGGAYSLLLKASNYSLAYVVDPCDYPKWVADRYKSAKINFVQKPAEEIDKMNFPRIPFEEVLVYNVLQHVINPEKIIKNAFEISKIIRVFEWVDNGISIGHPHDLKEDKLNEWLNGAGKVEHLNENGCVGKAYYGIFKGKYYE